MSKTKTAEILSITALLLITLALTAGAVYQAQHRQNVRNAAVAKADKQRDSARSDAVTAQFNLKAAQAQLQTVTADKVAACSALAAHKLVVPACVPPKE